jgi:hypothetical protein
VGDQQRHCERKDARYSQDSDRPICNAPTDCFGSPMQPDNPAIRVAQRRAQADIEQRVLGDNRGFEATKGAQFTSAQSSISGNRSNIHFHHLDQPPA